MPSSWKPVYKQNADQLRELANKLVQLDQEEPMAGMRWTVDLQVPPRLLEPVIPVGEYYAQPSTSGYHVRLKRPAGCDDVMVVAVYRGTSSRTTKQIAEDLAIELNDE